MQYSDNIQANFQALFNEEPLLVRSPGRVNLIGEHTDYNMGFVMPAAIDKAIYFAVSPRIDNRCMLYAADMKDGFEFAADRPAFSEKGWPNYLMGVVDQLNKTGHAVSGFNCVFGGDIPMGAGLSSSAAVEAGLAFALNHIFNLNLDKLTLVKTAQAAENKFVGVNCGIMDQYINIFGEAGTVLRIDCRSLIHEYFPFDYKNISIVLFNTNVSHALASSEYNLRRQECTNGVAVLKQAFPGTQSLRDVSVSQLMSCKNDMDPVVYRRCKYAVEENARLLEAGEVLKRHDLKRFGELMHETHEGLSKDYEVSCPELDYLVELTKENPKVYGARMMGGGFGGCTINLIENEEIEAISAAISEKYTDKFGLHMDTYVTRISNGTAII